MMTSTKATRVIILAALEPTSKPKISLSVMMISIFVGGGLFQGVGRGVGAGEDQIG